MASCLPRALGVLLRVLLGAPHPVSRAQGSMVDVLAAIVETVPPKVSAVSPLGRAIARDLDAIVARAEAKRPADRYGSVEAFAADLRRYLRREPVVARQPSLTYRAALFVRRHVRGVMAAGVVVLVLVGLAALHAQRLAAERDRAQREAARSARVVDLLSSLFTAADPYATPRGEPTVSGVLAAGADQVRRDLADDPALRADMLALLGRVHQRLGRHDAAQTLLMEALALGREASPDGSATVAYALTELGVLLRERGEPEASLPTLEEALAMRRLVLGDRHPDVAITLVELGRTAEDLGDLDRAERAFRDGLVLRPRASPTSGCCCATAATMPPPNRCCGSRSPSAGRCSARSIPTWAPGGTTWG